METAGYIALGRQSGLIREMDIVANNIANVSTTGFRREGLTFAEHVVRLPDEASVSLAHGNARIVDLSQAGLVPTGGTFDFAIQGEGFFLVETQDGPRLTRAGAFSPSAEGELVTADGHRLLDAGGAPVVIPAGAKTLALANDGSLSADGQPVAQIGLWQATDPLSMRHVSGTLFQAGEVEPLDGAVIRQGFLEESNVTPVVEIARMVWVQRAYELGQKFLDAEDARARNVIQTLGR